MLVAWWFDAERDLEWVVALSEKEGAEKSNGSRSEYDQTGATWQARVSFRATS